MRHVTSNKPVKGYVNQTAERTEVRERVVCPSPLFNSARDKLAMDAALLENPRRAGEDVIAWLERVNVAAGQMLLSQCETASCRARTGLPTRRAAMRSDSRWIA